MICPKTMMPDSTYFFTVEMHLSQIKILEQKKKQYYQLEENLTLTENINANKHTD